MSGAKQLTIFCPVCELGRKRRVAIAVLTEDATGVVRYSVRGPAIGTADTDEWAWIDPQPLSRHTNSRVILKCPQCSRKRGETTVGAVIDSSELLRRFEDRS